MENSKMKTIECNTAKISDVFTYKRFCKYETILNQSATGTGKTFTFTKHLARYLKENPKIRFITVFGKKSLGEQHFQGFQDANIENLCHYKDKDFYDNYRNKNILICVNSLFKITPLAEDIKNYILIIDEVSIFTSEITHNETISNLVQVYSMLKLLIKFSHKVYACQNLINDSAFLLLKNRLTFKSKSLYIKNNFKNNSDKEAIRYNSLNQLLEKMKDDIENNKYFLFSCDSKKQTDIIYKKFFDEAEHKEKFIKFSSDPNERYKSGFDWESKWAFYTPTIGAGIDVNLDTKQNHYVYIVGGSVGGDIIYQMSMRTRKLNKLYYYCDNTKPTKCKYKNFSHCFDTLKHNKEVMNNSLLQMCFVMDKSDQIVFTENSFYELYASNEFLIEKMNSNVVESFEMELKNSGFNIIRETIDCDDYAQELTSIKKELKEFKEEEFNKFIEDEIENEYMTETSEILRTVDKDDKILAKDLFLSSYNLQNHFNIIRIFSTDEYVNGKIETLKNLTYDDKLLKNVYIQIKHIKYIMYSFNICMYNINKDKKENVIIGKTIYDILKSIFNFRGTIKTKYDIIKFVCCRINKLCGEFFKFNKHAQEYTINKDYIANNFYIYNLRNKNFCNIEKKLIDYLDIEIDEEHDIFEVFGITQ